MLWPREVDMIRPGMRKVWGWFLLFLAYDFLWVGFAAALLLSCEGDEGYIAIGTSCVLAAGAVYAARVGLEDGRWERLYMPLLPAVLAGVFAMYGIAGEEEITVLEVPFRFAWVLLVGGFLALPSILVHLSIRNGWNRSRS